VHELAVQFLDYLGVVQHDLRDERPRLQVAPPLTFEKVPFGAHKRASRQRIEQIRHATSRIVSPADRPSGMPGHHSVQRARFAG
jgi:hypothetical protein